MLNDLDVLIGIEIELKIRDSTLPIFTHKTYYLTISFHCNCISTLNKGCQCLTQPVNMT